MKREATGLDSEDEGNAENGEKIYSATVESESVSKSRRRK